MNKTVIDLTQSLTAAAASEQKLDSESNRESHDLSIAKETINRLQDRIKILTLSEQTAQEKRAELEKQLGIYKKSLSEAEQEKSDAINKHDEMFNSVSSLNQRIEELEQHKLHLLEKLKGYGDKGGLEYIVKTQKLEDVQSREFDTRVVVEDYDPMKSR